MTATLSAPAPVSLQGGGEISPNAQAVLSAYLSSDAADNGFICYTSEAPRIARAIRAAAVSILDDGNAMTSVLQREHIKHRFLLLAREVEQSWPPSEGVITSFEIEEKPVLPEVEEDAPEVPLGPPPENRFRPGDVWLSPRGFEFRILNKHRPMGSRRLEVAVEQIDCGRITWRAVDQIGKGRNLWRRISWGGNW